MVSNFKSLSPYGFSGLFVALTALGFPSVASIPPLHPSLYSVQMQHTQVVASPTHQARAQALRVVESLDCDHTVQQDSRIVFQGSCGYLSALFHYLPDGPPEHPKDGARQITGGFSLTRKNAGSYALLVAKPIQFHRAVTPVVIPTVKSLPIPRDLKR